MYHLGDLSLHDHGFTSDFLCCYGGEVGSGKLQLSFFWKLAHRSFLQLDFISTINQASDRNEVQCALVALVAEPCDTLPTCALT